MLPLSCLIIKETSRSLNQRQFSMKKTERIGIRKRPRFVRFACLRVWRNVVRQSKRALARVPIVMIPVLHVESILRTWTPDSP